MKKIVCLFLTLAMLLSMMAACGTGDTAGTASASGSAVEETTPAQPEENDAPILVPEQDSTELAVSTVEAEPASVSYPITEEPLTLSIFWQFHNFLSMFNVTQDVIADIPTFKLAEEKTGVKLDFRLVGEENFGNSLQLMWASGDYCDLITNAEREYSTGVDSAVEDGVLLDLVPYLTEHAPDYNRILDDHPDFRLELTSSEGHIVSFSEYCEYSDSGAVIRMDWLKQVGMDVPQTMDEVTEVARAFRDKLGIRNPVMWNSDLATFFGWNAFGVTGPGLNDLGWQVLEDGKTVAPSVTLEGYQECLQWMHDAFQEGLCTDDFMQVMNIAFDEYVYANQTGMCYSNSNLLSGGGAERSGQPDYDLRAIPDPMKEKGMENAMAKTTGGVGASALSVSALTEYPVEAVEYMNWLYTEEGILVSNYGFEGDAFEYDENGKPQYTAIITEAEGMPPFVATFLHTSLVGTPYYNTTERKIASFTTEAERECIDVWLTGRTGANIYQGKMTAVESEEYNRTCSDIATAASEQGLRFVTGDRPLSEYDSFLQDLENMGLSRLTEIKQAAYDRYLES